MFNLMQYTHIYLYIHIWYQCQPDAESSETTSTFEELEKSPCKCVWMCAPLFYP